MSSNTPRKSSIASRRAPPPASLRLPSASRKASNPHLSLIFAQGGSSVPVTPIGDVSKVEAALSRQLDADLGGQRMSLRSRRGSSATVNTIHTTTGSYVENGDGMKSPVVLEDPDEYLDMPTAGPSRTSGTYRTNREVNQDFVNPKQSNAWKRWNPPPPTFPKSGTASIRSKGKGKEVIGNGGSASLRSVATEKPPVTSDPFKVDDERSGVASLAKDEVFPTKPPNGEATKSLAPPRSEEPPGVVMATPKKSWWYWSTSAAPSPAPSRPLAATPDLPADPPITPDVIPPPQEAPSSPALKLSPVTPDSIPPDEEIPALAAEIVTAEPPKEIDRKTEDMGWRTYLSWGRSDVNPTVSAGPKITPVQESIVPTKPSKPLSVKNSDLAPADPSEPSVTIPVPAVSQPSSLDPTPEPSSTNLHQVKSGWGTYLYSFVAPTPVADPASSRSNAPTPAPIPPTAALYGTVSPPATTSKPPERDIPTAIEVPPPNTAETPSNIPDPIPVLEPTPSAPSLPPPATRKGSAASTTGWLSYLAFRAAQKKITGSTIASSGSKSARPSGELVREEVMDLSADPNFPAESKPTPQPSITTAKDTKAMKPASGMEIRGKRLSISSARSAQNTPLSSSPMTTRTDGRPASAKLPTVSALPPPPQPPSVQPNLVIPTFGTTFHRPPRSLPPLPPIDSSTGLAAATGGLAWKALAAAGTYVYRNEPKGTNKPSTPEVKEIRGLKEGRGIGRDLPRRVGLLGESEDAGWKSVTRVVVVGVHGWFPAKMLNSVIGEPTGTSTKFATMMGAAVTKFFDEKGVKDLRLTLMPLEGEGTIDHRVDKLYKAYLSNPAWINEIRRADAIFFAAHSQGCIVTTHLLSRMIAQGHIRTALNRDAVSRCEWAFGPVGLLPPEEPRRGKRAPNHTGSDGGYQRVAMLAMCGVHLGPLYSISTSTVIQPYLQWFENAAARELFEFQDSNSAVSVAYQNSFNMILENDVRVVLLASLNDQVVPIYGASFSTATHPLLLRALFVDGASYSTGDFMTNLICFAFMLRNAGIDDQRLVEHLSEATAGSLTGLGHSSPYEEPACYSLVVEYLFRAGPAQKPHEPLNIEPFSAKDNRNDFELPWIMRALVDSPEVKDLFPEELKDLKEGILNWKPNTKALREIKRRLEPMAGRQSKLKPLAKNSSSTSLNSQYNAHTPSGGKGNLYNGKDGSSGLSRDW